MATTFVDVLLQLRDELGAEALSGGKIQTDEAGTTTPLATYTDLAGSSANTNPVILDAAGMAIIRQTDGVAYKWRVYDSDDNLLWTRDNITVGVSSASAASAYLIHIVHKGTVDAQGWMGGHIFDDDITLPIDFEGSQGAILTNPAASFEASIRKNGAEVGTATISTAGAFTFATTGGTTVTFTTGDQLDVYGPDVADGSAANIKMTLAGTVD
jgi:hypothetical protein